MKKDEDQNNMDLELTTAEQLELDRQKANNRRIKKLTEDRKPKNGRKDLAQTDGLKPVYKAKNKPIVLDDDDFSIDLSRVRNLKDVISYDD
jgi:hypothetical protein